MANLSADDLSRLRDSLRENYDGASDLRKSRAACIKLFAGSEYPNLDADDNLSDLVNLMRRSGMAQVFSLAANRPRFLVLSHDPKLKAWAGKIGRALDAYSKQLKLERVLQRCALNAFFGLGVAKTAMVDLPSLSLSMRDAQMGRPGVIDVSQDHMCWDMEAAQFDRCAFIADRYPVRWNDIISDTRISASQRAELKRQGPQNFSHGSDWAETIAPSTRDDVARFEKFVYCCDVFVPSQQCIYMFGCNEEFEITTEPLRPHVTWEGKPTGPYSFLSLGEVPGNTKPSSPAQNIFKQHNLINTVYRKINDTILGLKTVYTCATGFGGDATRIRDADDKTIIEMANGAGLQEWKADSSQLGVLYSILTHLLEQYNSSDGNSTYKMGLGAQTDTATQEGIIGQNVSRSEAHDQTIFVDFVREIAGELAGLLYRDVSTRVRMSLKVPGTEIWVADDWMPASVEASRPMEMGENGEEQIRELADFADIDIEPYSLPYKAPGARAEELKMFWNEHMPAWEMMGQQGIQPDFAAYLETQSRYRNLPELKEMLKQNQAPPPPSEGGEQRSLQPQSDRIYKHQSMGSGSGSGQGGDQTASLLAAAQSNNQNR